MLKIGDFSKQTDLSVKTLRYYDEIDFFKPAFIDPFTGYRYYTEEQVTDLMIIRELKKLDLSLEEIKEYFKTKDIKILIRKKGELEMKIKEVVKFINKEYENYTIYEGDYEKYILNNGLLRSECAQALEVRDGNAKYYVIEKNKKPIDDFVIYINKGNWITIENSVLLNDDYVALIFSYLAENDYKFITTYIPIERENITSHIDKKYKNITKKIERQSGYEYIKYIINL